MTSINTSERIYGVHEYDALQRTKNVQMAPLEHSFDANLVVDFTQFVMIECIHTKRNYIENLIRIHTQFLQMDHH